MEKNSHYLEWLEQNTERQLQARYGDIVGRLTRLSEGSMNLTFSGETGVVHVGEEPKSRDPLIEEASLPHIYRHKGRVLSALNMRLHIPPSDTITVPHSLFYDTVSIDGHDFSVWGDEKVSNITESPISESEHSKLITWVADLQRENRPASQASLIDHYQRRLALFNYALGTSSRPNDMPVHDILQFMQGCIQASVSADEKTGFVHGDLNRSNLLTYRDECKDKIAVIDFEKSPFPGDKLVDPIKLLKLKRLYLPARHGADDEELSDKARIRLMKDYLKRTKSPSLDIRQIVLRDALVNLDTIMSVYVARVSQPGVLSRGAPVGVLENYAATYYEHAKRLLA